MCMGASLSSRYRQGQASRIPLSHSFHPRSGLVVYSVLHPKMCPNMSKPLWQADDQHARLSEVIASSDEPAKDNPLRRDVRSLGAILGQVLVEQSGQEVFESVEVLR